MFFIIFLIIYGETGQYASEAYLYATKKDPKPTKSEVTGDTLTLLAIFYGSSASWCSMASDYYVHYPVNVSRVKVFIMTTLGIALPTSFGMCAGAVVSSAFTDKKQWAEYNAKGLGYVIQGVLYPRGFSDFILVVFILSGLGVNIIVSPSTPRPQRGPPQY